MSSKSTTTCEQRLSDKLLYYMCMHGPSGSATTRGRYTSGWCNFCYMYPDATHTAVYMFSMVIFPSPWLHGSNETQQVLIACLWGFSIIVSAHVCCVCDPREFLSRQFSLSIGDTADGSFHSGFVVHVAYRVLQTRTRNTPPLSSKSTPH